jgi:cysteine desulfurase
MIDSGGAPPAGAAAVRRPAYLDNAATTPVDPRVAARMSECLTTEGAFGNPGSSSHAQGEAAHALVEAAREQVAAAVGAEPADIVWTSGATESDNLALFGVAQHYREQGMHIVTARTEHKAVLDPCRELERRGWRVTYLEPDRDGWLEPQRIAAALRPDTVLVSLMHVNNEIGVVQDVAAIARVVAAHGRARLHVDAAQSVGKCAVEVGAWGADLVSLSAHKAHGPKGVGALVVARSRGVQLQALQFGGGQERSLRPGTVPTHQVVGMGAAFALAASGLDTERERIGALCDRLWRGIDALGGVLRNGRPERCVPHVLNVSFEGVEGESLLADVRPWIAVSTGSACTSASAEPSYVLRALGRSDRLAESSLRFSLGRFTTVADIDAAIAAVSRAVRRLRRLAGVGVMSSRAAAVRDGAHEDASTGGGAAGGADAAGDGDAAPAVANYNNLTWRHFGWPARAGALDPSDPGVRRASAGSPDAGTWVQFEARSGPDGIVTAMRFRAFGCPHVIAVADWLAEAAPGRPGGSALPESVQALRQRFDVPVEKTGRMLLVEDAWKRLFSTP